ncbi:MAG: RimK family alpha-L-glutamate ligase [Bacteroidales bacterium]|jgi:gamma-F420-2:alpha-L-glutamate ligase
MLGWILHKHSDFLIKPEIYEINKIVEEGKSLGVDIQVFKPEQIEIIVNRDDRKSIFVNDVSTSLPDFILPRMGAGTTYFALALIRHLEKLGIYSFNSANSIDIVKDKLYQLQVLAESGMPIPKTMLAKFPLNLDIVAKHIGFPVVVKTLSGSQGSGVFLCETHNSLDELMHMIENSNPNVNLIFQEFINTSHGRDLRVVTVGGRIVGAMVRTSSDGSFKANYSRGGTITKFDITPEIEWLTLEIARILDLDIAGIDLLFDGDGFKICEVNSSPGFEGLEKACNKNIAREIIQFIKLRIDMKAKGK